METATLERPVMFRVGVALTAAQAGLVILAVGVGVVLATVGVGVGVSSAEGEGWRWVAGMGGVIGVLLGVLLFVNLGLLYVCWRAWEGEPGWVLGLAVLSGVHALLGGPIAVGVGVVTAVGCLTWREELLGGGLAGAVARDGGSGS